MNATLLSYAYLMIAIIAEVAATTALKASESFTKLGPSIIVVLGYGLAFWCLSLTLRTMSVGVAYAIWSGIGMVLIAALGWLIYKQSLDLPALIGIGLILIGVLIVNLFSKSVTQ